VTAYTHALQALADRQSLIATLRRFELVLLSQLGYAIDFKNDRLGVPIQPHLLYRYQRDEGFALHTSGETGMSLLAMGDLSDEVPLILAEEITDCP